MSSKGLALRCFLRSLGNTVPDIALPDGEDVLVGRGPNTKIKDRRCSKQQLRLRADYINDCVRLEVCGDNASAILTPSPVDLRKGQVHELHNNDVVQVLKDLYPFKIVVVETKNKVKTTKRAAAAGNEEATPDKVAKTISVKSPKKKEKYDIYRFTKIKTLREDSELTWEHMEDIVYIMTTKECRGRSKIAAFDIDHTLIAPSSGRVFPTSRDDWKLLWPETKSKLRQLYEDDFKIVIFTNQGGLATGQTTLADFTHKMEAIHKKLNLPLQIFCSASSRGMFRKPRMGLWELLKRLRNDNIEIDMSKSFYCGDAAGRFKDWMPKKRKDFSCSDRLFALNLKLEFVTPEEFFLNQKPTDKFAMPEFDPCKLKEKQQSLLEPEMTKLVSESQEVIMMVGVQGSGKSFFAQKHLKPHNYVIVSNDLSGGRDKTIKLLEENLKNGSSVVVDNTHVDVEARKRFLDVVQKFKGVKARCFVMSTTLEHAMHNDVFREVTDPNHVKLKQVTLYTYRKRFQKPTVEEGFSEVVQVNFLPSFDSEVLEKLYYSYLLEK